METLKNRTLENTINLIEQPPCSFETIVCPGCGEERKPIWSGLINKWLRPNERCDACAEKERLKIEAEEVEYQKTRARERYMESSGLKARHLKMEFDSFKPKNDSQKKALETLREWKGDCGIFISGPVGTGKTHLAVALLKKAIQNCRKAEIVTGVSLLYEIKATFDDKRINADDVISEYSQLPLLVIDDLGAEKSTDWAKEILYLIIDNRYSDMLPTIVTSNLTPKELAEKLDDRLVSRLMEDTLIIKIEGKDHRIGNARQDK